MELWQRRDSEPEVAWAAFAMWRDQGPKRSFTALGHPLADVLAWRAQWAWDDRVTAYDAWVSESLALSKKRILILNEEQETAKRFEALAMVVEREAEKWVAKVMTSPDPVMTIAELTKLVDMLSRRDDLVNGRPTERIQVTAKDYQHLTDEEIGLVRAKRA